MYNFVDWIKNIDLYALIDGIIALTFVILFIIFFAYKRHLRVLCLLTSVFVLDILVQVLAQLHQGEALTLARYCMHYFTILVLIVVAVVYQNDFKSIFQKLGNPKGQVTMNSVKQPQKFCPLAKIWQSKTWVQLSSLI